MPVQVSMVHMVLQRHMGHSLVLLLFRVGLVISRSWLGRRTLADMVSTMVTQTGTVAQADSTTTRVAMGDLVGIRAIRVTRATKVLATKRVEVTAAGTTTMAMGVMGAVAIRGTSPSMPAHKGVMADSSPTVWDMVWTSSVAVDMVLVWIPTQCNSNNNTLAGLLVMEASHPIRMTVNRVSMAVERESLGGSPVAGLAVAALVVACSSSSRGREARRAVQDPSSRGILVVSSPLDFRVALLMCQMPLVGPARVGRVSSGVALVGREARLQPISLKN